MVSILKLLGLISNSASNAVRQFEIDRRSNFQLDITICFENLIRCEAFRKIYEKRVNGTEESFEEWGNRIIKYYKIKSKKEYAEYSVKFNVKNGVLYEDDKISYFDAIYSEVFLPLSPPKEDEEDDWNDSHSIEHCITVRLLIINGFLNVEVGRFDKASSPRIYDNGFFAKYEHFSKVTCFPMIFVSWAFGLPSKYLSPHFQATKHYKDNYLLVGSSKKAIDVDTDDWQKFNTNLEKYNKLVCDYDSPTSNFNLSEFKKLILDFHKQGREFLIQEKFKDPSDAEEETSYWRWEDGSKSFGNNLISVNLMDWNSRLETFKENMFADYWEESI